ncbi:RPA-interacting protein isoform X1 [Apus apus]|uniref:RPA-interacting protein isoform X1 n=1 Tax=Apus apus TaxID=8895 RepID=UPI0021F851D3|nr:RPA-interacting protein isoform X1 [Apus apus]
MAMETAVRARGRPRGAAPPWKEAYRRRCMERLRKSRAKLLERYRQAGERVNGPAALLAQEVMEQEWQTLQEGLPWGGEALAQMPEDPDELAVLEEIEQELILQGQLAMEEYQYSLQFDEECLNAMLDGLDASDGIICPVCRKNNLTVRNDFVFCQCGLHISTQGMTEEKLRSLLENAVTEHSHQCFHSPQFTVTSGMEEEPSLLMSCSVCDSWTILL